ncbi:putative coiled-coil protein SlyX [Rahnella inusitata]|nr:putative coiled-coil protein SlyX [Rahnella inusitata]
MPQPVNILTREIIEDNESFPHTTSYGDGNGGGDDMLEARVAKLEADVENIKTNIAETRMDIRELTKSTSSIRTDVSTMLQKLVDIDEKLSSKASKDFVEVKTGNLKSWMLGILLLSIAMPVITLLVNLYMKKP